jgi:hypothetical protein
MGTTNDDNKDFTDFSLSLCARFFSPAETLGRGGGLVCMIFSLLAGMQPSTKLVMDVTI